MIEAWVGEEAFRKGVNAYIEKFQYGNARAEDFWTTLTKATGKPVDRVMATFVDQPGLPLIAVDVRCTGDAAQTRPVAGTVSRAIRPRRRRRRRSPGRFRSASRPPPARRRATAAGAAGSRSLRTAVPAWVIGNAGARGYYRVGRHRPTMVQKLAADIVEAVARRADGRPFGRVGAGARRPPRRRDVARSRCRVRQERTADVVQHARRRVAGCHRRRLHDRRDAQRLSRLGGAAARARRSTTSGWRRARRDTDETQALRATLVGARSAARRATRR